MARVRINYNDFFPQVTGIMTAQGLLLGSYDSAGEPNVMTIGWGTLGQVWGVPVWTVLVRPSRYTFQCIEHSGCFTVNVPTKDMGMVCATCGSVSGRDVDKFERCNLTAQKAETVLAPIVAECPIVYECQAVHSNDILPEKLAGEILSGAYVDGDYHRIYFGKILAARAVENAAEFI